MINVKEKAGVLITHEQKNLWILYSCWDHQGPFNLHECVVHQTIVLNQNIEGCLPLTSLLAADDRIDAEKIYVLNRSNPHDWHPSYNDFQKENIQKLISSRELPSESGFGSMKIYKPLAGNFVNLVWTDDRGDKNFASIGEDIFLDKIEDGFDRLYIIGSLDPEKMNLTGRLMMDFYMARNLAEGTLNIFICRDMYNANGRMMIEGLNALGMEVHAIGKAEP